MNTLDGLEIDEVLRNVGYGFLGLSQNNRPYVIPMSFGYDGEAIHFQMNSQGRKFEYMENNPVASLAVLAIDEATGISKSVIVEGNVTSTASDEEKEALEALAENAEFGTDFDIWGDLMQEADLSLLTLTPTTVTGRVFGRI